MELLQLRYFLESANTESFSKTAEKFTVPTTSVSASIKRLEKELGVKLFDRTANTISLNKHGKRLKTAVKALFNELDLAILDLSLQDEDKEIKMLVKAVRSNVTDFVIDYRKTHPSTTFKTVFDFAEKNYQNYDIIIDEKNNHYQGYNSFELMSIKLEMKVSKDKYTHKKLKLKDLSNENFISWGENSNMHNILIKACENAGFTPNISVKINDNECYERLIKAGVGIGLGRSAPEKDFPHIKYLDVTDFSERYDVFCYYNPNSLTGSVKNFINYLKNVKKDV